MVQTLPLIVWLMVLLPRAGAVADEPQTATFRDPDLGLAYRYPAAFQQDNPLAIAIKNGHAQNGGDDEAQKAAKCIKMPLIAAKGTPAAGSEIGFILLMTVDYACMDEQNDATFLGGDAQTLMRVLEMFGRSVTEDAMHYKLQGHDAAFVQGSAPAAMLGEGAMLHAASVCTLIRKLSVCWLIVDSDYRIMPSLVANPVIFDGRDAVPLVPKDYVEKW